MKACQWRAGCRRGEGRQPAPATKRDHCRYHYEYLRVTGGLAVRQVDAGPVAERIREHLARGPERGLGWLAREVGMAGFTLHRYVRGERRRMGIDAFRRVMAVPLPPSDIGCVRRVRALQRMGWTLPALCEVAGIEQDGLKSALRRKRFSSVLAQAVLTVYSRLSDVPPPRCAASTAGRREARKWGYASPLAWEGVDIDDPAAEPIGVELGRVVVPRCEWCGEAIESQSRVAPRFCGTGHREAFRAAKRAAQVRPMRVAKSHLRTVR